MWDISITSDQPVLLLDNASVVKLTKDEFHKQSKHIEVKWYFVREKYLNGEIDVQHNKGEKQLADILTKALWYVRFAKLRGEVGVSS